MNERCHSHNIRILNARNEIYEVERNVHHTNYNKKLQLKYIVIYGRLSTLFKDSSGRSKSRCMFGASDMRRRPSQLFGKTLS